MIVIESVILSFISFLFGMFLFVISTLSLSYHPNDTWKYKFWCVMSIVSLIWQTISLIFIIRALGWYVL